MPPFLPPLANLFFAERDRWFLWSPVAMGVGVVGYFALTTEPPLWLLGVTPCLMLLAILARPSPFLPLAVGLMLVGLGFNAGQIAAWRVAAPMIDQPRGPVTLEGRVIMIEPVENGARLRLDRLTIPYLAPAQTPTFVRIKIKRPREEWPPTGAWIRLRAWLHPLSEPVAPDAYDFRRHGFFDQLGAVGWSQGKIDILDVPVSGSLDAIALTSETLRRAIADRIAARLKDDSAALAIALLNGQQNEISRPTMQAMRASGLQHLLSISGLHTSIVAGLSFFALRALLALIPWLALRLPIKKIAAAGAIVTVVGYTLLVTASVPTLRSMLMSSTVMLAVLLDRRALSLRLVALTAMIVMLAAPETIMGPSFQMSFAAVGAMIAWYEARRNDFLMPKEKAGRWRRTLEYFGAIALTSILATAATTPFVMYHFQTANWYGVLANMIAIPLTSFWVMPFGMLAYLLMPFGWEGWTLIAMGWGNDAVIALAKLIAPLPGAVSYFPAMPVWGLALVTFGGLWLCLWQQRWRWAGVPFLLIGLLSPALVRSPDLLISADGMTWAARLDDGRVVFPAKGDDFILDQWRQRLGQPDMIEVEELATRPESPARCDLLGCLMNQNNRLIALPRDPAALAEDCAEATLVAAPFPVPGCTAPFLIDAHDFARHGAMQIYAENDAVKTDPVRLRRGGRPWSVGWRGDEK